jgi:hypothetical protein
MPRGPQGEKRPADVIGAAVIVAKIATGEVEERRSEKNPRDPSHWRQLAQEYRLKAVVTDDPKTKSRLIAFAEGYDRVADRVEQRLRDAQNSN